MSWSGVMKHHGLLAEVGRCLSLESGIHAIHCPSPSQHQSANYWARCFPQHCVDAHMKMHRLQLVLFVNVSVFTFTYHTVGVVQSLVPVNVRHYPRRPHGVCSRVHAETVVEYCAYSAHRIRADIDAV
eukprot:3442328-Amphidinium_carterae.1